MWKPKFKIGDKVKLLDGIVDEYVPPHHIGHIGEITDISTTFYFVQDGGCLWGIHEHNLKLNHPIGKQLKFDFMER